MRHFSFVKRLFAAVAVCFLSLGLSVYAQQLPDPSFEDWSGAKYDGKVQPKYWHGSNVTQMSFMFNLTNQASGHTGKYSIMVQNTEVGAMGITELAPGYFSLGQPWSYLKDITSIKKATAGTSGGINFTHRPDTMAVWIRRTGSNASLEDFHLLFYSWSGTAKGSSYKGKDLSCTAYDATNEESDIRQALDENECQTTQFANQIAEGWWREREQYDEWTRIKVPIYYMSSDIPEMCNVIFSASNYPNFRANSGLYKDNALYVDDVELIYASTIQQLYIGNKLWKGFDPNSTEEQVYSLGNQTTIPDIYAMRGAGELTNARGKIVNFPGRRLADNEISIVKGEIDGAPTTITVKSTDGSSSRTYKIKFISKPSNNAKLADILIDGVSLANFQGFLGMYDVNLPYGTTKTPVVSYVAAEDGQTITVTQPTSTSGTATINVTAPDGTTKMTYTLKFSVAKLSDNTLADIKINGESLASFRPKQNNYTIELPLGTTTLPTIEAVSAYPAGEQTITYTKPSVIDGGKYQITVKAPGNNTARTYTLTFKVTASTNTALKDLQVEGFDINYNSSIKTYYVSLPLGTTALPKITYVAGDEWQTITTDIPTTLEGTASIRVKSASGAEAVYKIIFQLTKSEINWLNDIKLDGVSLAGFDRDVFTYTVELPIGTTTLPKITYVAGDEYQTVTIREGGIEGTTRITVTAQDGSTNLYQLQFSVLKANNAKLKMIYVDGVALADFNPNTLEYHVNLPQGTSAVPQVTWEAGDEWQKVTVSQAISTSGTARITVRPQSGSAQTYLVHFSVNTSSNTALKMIYLDGVQLEGFAADKLTYDITLPEGVSTIPSITFDKVEAGQKTLLLEDNTSATIRVTAENGDTRTYTLNFTIQKSANAFLKMIYLDGKPLAGFDKEQLSGYSYTLPEGVDVCPIITVDKEAGQTVSIQAPKGAGQVKIIVQPEVGAANIYVVDILSAFTTDVLLNNIKLDGAPLAGFAPNVFTYDVSYQGNIPVVTADKKAGQDVKILSQKEQVIILVEKNGQQSVYTINFAHKPSAETTLANIAVNGVTIAGFTPTKYDYQLNLGAGESLPAITFTKGHASQTVVGGMTTPSVYTIEVTAENGDKKNYTIQVNVGKYDSANLLDIQLDGKTIVGFAPTTYIYNISWGKGQELPKVTYQKESHQTVLLTQAAEDKQILHVVAENGNQNTYTINYRLVPSTVATLAGLLVDGTPLEGFAANTFDYSYQLAHGAKVVPNVRPIAGALGQTITIGYSRVDGITTVHVLAADGATEAEYKIAFPVVKSAETALANLMDSEGFLIFQSDVNDYVVTLPEDYDYQTLGAPALTYEKGEPGQQIEVINPPMGETTKLIVTAENGDQRTYTVLYRPFNHDKANKLSSILVNGVPQDMSKVLQTSSTSATYELVVDMPYETTEFVVDCGVGYKEQTYMIQPGGTKRSTVITVFSNKPGVADATYIVKPNVVTVNPAHLTNISVNDVVIADFEKDRFSYIVRLDKSDVQPIVTAQVPAGVTVESETSTFSKWEMSISKDVDGELYENTYRVFFYYENEVIPNGEFKDWTNKVHNDNFKPTGWNVVSDISSGGTNGQEVVQEGTDVVRVDACYWGTLASNIPGFLTLAKVSGNFAAANQTKINIGTGISFHNTPDVLSINYKITEIFPWHTTHFVYSLKNKDGVEQKVEHSDAAVISDFTTLNLDLTPVNATVGSPTEMNILLNAYNVEKATTGDIQNFPSFKKRTTMYIDWVRFSYNNRLASIIVDEQILTPDADNKFVFTQNDAENDSQLFIEFVGEVADQAQRVVWPTTSTVVAGKSYRQVAIRNFGEDGNYTDYTLEVVRPLSTIKTLKGISVDGRSLAEFAADVLSYDIALVGNAPIPSISAQVGSNLQTVTITCTGDVVSIKVKAESGDEQTYTLHFKRTYSNDATLASIVADGVDEATLLADKTFTLMADKMPFVNFVKNHPTQTVTLKNGVLTVTAEDGKTKETYTINLQANAPTSKGFLEEITAMGMTPAFQKEQFDYEVTTTPTDLSFTRETYTDSVAQVMTDEKITLTVYGDETHTYTLLIGETALDKTDLQMVRVDGADYIDFLPNVDSYDISSNSALDIEVVPSKNQTLDVTYSDGTFQIDVTAADGTTKRANPYTIKVGKEQSKVATLNMIYLDGVAVEGFIPTTYNYQKIYAHPATQPKQAEPAMPIITYDLGDAGQSVEMISAGMGGVTYLIVTAEDGTTTAQYELHILSEASQYAYLHNLYVNGNQVYPWDPNVFDYDVALQSSVVNIQYATDDHFQTITVNHPSEKVYEVEVVAQDGVTKNTYTITVDVVLSNNAMLDDVLLNGSAFNVYDPAADNFRSNHFDYNINLPASATELPDVYVRLGEEGQTYQLQTNGDTYVIHVVAPNGVDAEDYTINFLRKKSTNALLDNIFVDGVALTDFAPDKTTYTVDLPSGQVTIPMVDFIPAERAQTVDVTTSGNVVTAVVTAEDGTTQKTYTITFNFLKSENCVLTMIYEDGEAMADFAATTYYYYELMPLGQRVPPTITWDQGDQWQTITVDTITNATTTTYQIFVVAESGHKNVYTLVYEIQLSAVDTLQMIYLDNQELVGFDARLMDYTVVVPDMNTLPIITWEAGDAYQTVTLDTLESANPLAVQTFALRAVAENGASRTYNITFTKALSTNANLAMITVGGTDIANFDGEVLNYTVALPYGTTTMPAVTYTKGEETQNVTLIVNGFTVQVIVVAEDGVTTQTYTINADVKKSDNAFLQNILLDNVSLADFDPQVQEYFITLPYGTEAWPKVTWVAGNEQQTIVLKSDSTAGVFTISVTSGDELNTSDYVLYFTVQPSSICTLDDLMINGVTVEGFAPEVNEYYIVWAPETSEDALYTVEDVTYVLTDTTATVAITAQDAFTITVIVTAADGVTMNAYIIHQEISLPNNAYLADLQLDGVTIKGFDPTVFDYEYLLLDGGIMPVVTAEAQDSTAEVAVTMGEMGDTTFIYCTAQDGTEYIYTIYIHYADMQITNDATAGDCILKHIPGTNQFLAATTRQGMKIALYSIYGQFIGMWDVPICDPNAVQWTSDYNGNEIILDVDVNSTGKVITLDHTQNIYVYTFIQNDEVLVKSGKVVVGR